MWTWFVKLIVIVCLLQSLSSIPYFGVGSSIFGEIGWFSSFVKKLIDFFFFWNKSRKGEPVVNWLFRVFICCCSRHFERLLGYVYFCHPIFDIIRETNRQIDTKTLLGHMLLDCIWRTLNRIDNLWVLCSTLKTLNIPISNAFEKLRAFCK